MTPVILLVGLLAAQVDTTDSSPPPAVLAVSKEELAERLRRAVAVKMALEAVMASMQERERAAAWLNEQILQLSPAMEAWGQELARTAADLRPNLTELTTGNACLSVARTLPWSLPPTANAQPLRLSELNLIEAVEHERLACRVDLAQLAEGRANLVWSFDRSTQAYIDVDAVLGEAFLNGLRLCDSLAAAADILNALPHARQATALNVVAAWQQAIEKRLRHLNASQASDMVASDDRLWASVRMLGQVTARINGWRQKRVFLLREMHAPHLALRAARHWHGAMEEIKEELARMELHPEVALDLHAVVADASASASRFVEEAEQHVATRAAEHSANRVAWVTHLVSNARRKLLPERCTQLAAAAVATDSAQAEEAFLDFLEGCQ
jgi:hypothetical protein